MSINPKEYDAIIVGAGPNGLAAAITLQRAGLSVLLVEGKKTVGGGLRTAGLTLPGFQHDVCSAIHPMAVASPFLQTLPLKAYGLEFLEPAFAAAHPFDDGSAAYLCRSIEATAASLGEDEQAYLDLIGPLVKNWEKLAGDILSPLKFPSHPLLMAGFGLRALQPAAQLAKRFRTEKAKGLWAGMSAHAIQPLSNWATGAIGMVLSAVGHVHGWPVPKGGSQQIANALAAHFQALGGEIQTELMVSSLNQLPAAKVVLLDLTPRQVLEIAGEQLSGWYRYQLRRYRYGMGVFKIDWALAEPIPFTASPCRQAGTVHLGNTFAEIARTEKQTAAQVHPEKPFVLLAQPSLFDSSRAPAGKHTAWAYCHVPHGSVKDMTRAIENQVERFAPGFKDIILDKHTMNTVQVAQYNPNYIGGDINGGTIDLGQLYTRPALKIHPYRTSADHIYICSSSTPPGGGVHGMCGYHAAQLVLKDVFNLKPSITENDH